MNTAPCGYVAFRDDGTIAAVNATLTEMLGYSRFELEGWHMEKILPPGGRIFYHTHVFPLLKLHGRVEEIYLALRTKKGTDVPVLLNAVRHERDGVPVSDCVCVRMLQRHEYEDQLLQARRLAEQANAAKAKFLSMMSHDLRTPLTTISGHASLLAAGADSDLSPEQQEGVESIREACRVLMSMINDILEFARIDSGPVQVQSTLVSVGEAVGRAASLIRMQVDDAGLRFEAAGCDPEIAVIADPGRLQQVLLNLLTNAIKFTPPGGAITVSCETAGDRVEIRVRDTGIGISADQVQTIFSPFVQLQASTVNTSVAGQRGVGLGLAISRDLARAMGGDVTAESTPGSGSVFTIVLPSAQALAV